MSESIDDLKRRLKKIGDEANEAYTAYKEKTHAFNWLQTQIDNLEADITAQRLKPFIGKYWRFSHTSDEWYESLVLFIKSIEVDDGDTFIQGVGAYVKYNKHGKAITAALKENAYFSTTDRDFKINLEWVTLNLEDATPSTKDEFLDMANNGTKRFLSKYEENLTED